MRTVTSWARKSEALPGHTCPQEEDGKEDEDGGQDHHNLAGQELHGRLAAVPLLEMIFALPPSKQQLHERIQDEHDTDQDGEQESVLELLRETKLEAAFGAGELNVDIEPARQYELIRLPHKRDNHQKR